MAGPHFHMKGTKAPTSIEQESDKTCDGAQEKRGGASGGEQSVVSLRPTGCYESHSFTILFSISLSPYLYLPPAPEVPRCRFRLMVDFLMSYLTITTTR